MFDIIDIWCNHEVHIYVIFPDAVIRHTQRESVGMG